MSGNYKENKIGSATAGDSGHPGSGYSVLWVGVAHYADDEFEARAKWARGSNQGYLEEHDSLSTRGRGASVAEALEIVAGDVLEWDCDSITIPERRAALRECKYEAQDWLKDKAADPDSDDVKEAAGESSEARELREACESAAHCFNTLIADDDEVLSVLRKLDGGEDLIGEIRSVARRWTDASQAFLESLTKKGVTA
jgi:hypothetical protein